MKNLKRTLCLMLACCLTVGLLAVSASAAFDDQSDIQHLEAATVLNELEVLQGYSDGTFGPDDTLTRAQAAALIARMLLGVDNADSMVTSSAPFSDVATSHWAAGYISYCVSVGIVAGYGDGRFGPEDTLTIGAFAKMLVGALGYDSDFEELAGSSWLINTAKLAVSNDLLDDVAASYTASCSRDNAAQMVFNTLQATLVEYSSGGIKVEVGDTTINMAPSTAEKKDANSYDGNIEEDDYLQFAEHYFPDLVLNVDVDAAFGRPSAYNWELDGAVIFESADDGDLLDSYTTKVSEGTLYNLIGLTAYKELKAETATLTVWVDGVEENNPDYSDYFVKNSSSEADGTGSGVLTEIYMDDDNHVTIVQIHTYLAVATDDYDEDDELLEIEIYNHDELDEYTLYLEDFDVEGLEEDDWLLVTVDDDEVYTVSFAYMVEGEITGYSVDSSITLDGEKYYYSNTFDNSTFASDSFSIGSDIVLILDPYGYVLGNDDVETDNDYVFIAEVASSGSLSNSGYVAAAYFTDGTYAEIKLKNVDDDTPDTDDFGWFTYTVNSAGKYLLDSVDMTYYISDDTNVFSTRNGYVRFLLDDDGDAEDVRATNSTVFVVVDDDGDVDTYTGYKNVPTINTSGDDEIAVYVVANSSGYASYVFIYAGDASIKNAVSESSDVLFVYDVSSYGVNADRYDNTYYDYDCSLINGEDAVVYTTFKLTSVGLYIDVTYDDYGYIDDAELVTDTIDDEILYVDADEANVAYASGVLTIDDVDFALADICDIFLIDNEDYDTVTVTKFVKTYDDELTASVYGVMDDDEVIAIYVVLD